VSFRTAQTGDVAWELQMSGLQQVFTSAGCFCIPFKSWLFLRFRGSGTVVAKLFSWQLVEGLSARRRPQDERCSPSQ
jgi:hypothetical protein